MVGSWLGVVALLVVLNIAFHGTLVNEFKVPGTDFQKATDLIDAKFGAQKGAPLRVVIAAPEGETLHTPERAGGGRQDARAGRRQRARSWTRTPKDVGAITDPLAAGLQRSSRRAAGSPTSTRSSTAPASSCRAATSSISRTS